MSEILGCGHPDKNRACGDCLDEVATENMKLSVQVEEMKTALASLPCKHEGTYGSPTPEHFAFAVCPPCWARKELGLIEKRSVSGPKHEGGGLDLTKTLVCRELVDWGHGDVFECGNPLPCTNPIHAQKQQIEKRSHEET